VTINCARPLMPFSVNTTQINLEHLREAKSSVSLTMHSRVLEETDKLRMMKLVSSLRPLTKMEMVKFQNLNCLKFLKNLSTVDHHRLIIYTHSLRSTLANGVYIKIKNISFLI